MGPKACTVSQYLYRTGILLQPLWTVRPVQSLNPCTLQLYLYSHYGPYGLYRASVHVQYSYTSTPPMGRTASTEPQCLYSTAIPLLPLLAVRPVQRLSACTRLQFTFIFYLENKWQFISKHTSRDRSLDYRAKRCLGGRVWRGAPDCEILQEISVGLLKCSLRILQPGLTLHTSWKHRAVQDLSRKRGHVADYFMTGSSNTPLIT